MKLRLWSGAIALVFLAACGGGTTTPTTSTTAPITEATSAVVPTEVVAGETATPAMMETMPSMEETATAGMMEATAEPTTGMMAETATAGIMDETATASMMDETATASMMDETATAGMMETTTAMDSTAAADVGDQAAADAIREAMRKQLTGGPFRAETTIESNGQTYTVTGEFIPPSRLRTTSNIGGVANETIIIEDKAWTKVGDSWQELPNTGVNVSEMMGAIVSNPDENGMQISNAQEAGTEDVNGVSAAVYTYDSSYTMEGVTANSTGKLWIDPASGLPIKAESDGEANGIQTKTTQVITYDSSIAIEPPTQ